MGSCSIFHRTLLLVRSLRLGLQGGVSDTPLSGLDWTVVDPSAEACGTGATFAAGGCDAAKAPASLSSLSSSLSSILKACRVAPDTISLKRFAGAGERVPAAGSGSSFSTVDGGTRIALLDCTAAGVVLPSTVIAWPLATLFGMSGWETGVVAADESGAIAVFMIGSPAGGGWCTIERETSLRWLCLLDGLDSPLAAGSGAPCGSFIGRNSAGIIAGRGGDC